MSHSEVVVSGAVVVVAGAVVPSTVVVSVLSGTVVSIKDCLL